MLTQLDLRATCIPIPVVFSLLQGRRRCNQVVNFLLGSPQMITSPKACLDLCHSFGNCRGVGRGEACDVIRLQARLIRAGKGSDVAGELIRAYVSVFVRIGAHIAALKRGRHAGDFSIHSIGKACIGARQTGYGRAIQVCTEGLSKLIDIATGQVGSRLALNIGVGCAVGQAQITPNAILQFCDGPLVSLDFGMRIENPTACDVDGNRLLGLDPVDLEVTCLLVQINIARRLNGYRVLGKVTGIDNQTVAGARADITAACFQNNFAARDKGTGILSFDSARCAQIHVALTAGENLVNNQARSEVFQIDPACQGFCVKVGHDIRIV